MPDIAGLKLIVPTSVSGSGVSVSASGKVTFTAATAVNVNGCFTSTYDNYLVVIRSAASTSLEIQMRLRVGGTDNSTASSYTRQQLAADNTTVNGERASANITRFLPAYNTQRVGSHAYFYGPALAQPTAVRCVNVSDSSSAFIRDYAITHNQSTAYDGFSLIPDIGNITGALCVYGLSQ